MQIFLNKTRPWTTFVKGFGYVLAWSFRDRLKPFCRGTCHMPPICHCRCRWHWAKMNYLDALFCATLKIEVGDFKKRGHKKISLKWKKEIKRGKYKCCKRWKSLNAKLSSSYEVSFGRGENQLGMWHHYVLALFKQICITYQSHNVQKQECGFFFQSTKWRFSLEVLGGFRNFGFF